MNEFKYIKSQVRKLFKYLLMYRYYPYRQKKEWIFIIDDTMINIQNYLMDDAKLITKFYDDKIMDDLYSLGIYDAVRECGIEQSKFETSIIQERPKGITINSCMDDDFIFKNWLTTFARSHEAKYELRKRGYIK